MPQVARPHVQKVRLNADELALLRTWARAAGHPVARLIREAALGNFLKIRIPRARVDGAAVHDLLRVVTRLDALERGARAAGGIPQADHLAAMREAVDALTDHFPLG